MDKYTLAIFCFVLYLKKRRYLHFVISNGTLYHENTCYVLFYKEKIFTKKCGYILERY